MKADEPVSGWAIPKDCQGANLGLTVRDHIAIEAMKSAIIGAAIHTEKNDYVMTFKNISEQSYQQADAMIKESNNGS